MLSKQMRGDERLAPVLEKITQQTFRASEIVNGLLNFSRTSGDRVPQHRSQPGPSRYAVAARASVQDRADSRRNRISIRSLPRIHGNPGKLQQVILNLLLNAKEAMLGRSNATLKIATFNGSGDVFVRIQDSGGGIAREHLNRIYDPFFTTKTTPQAGEHKGTGLGLSVSYGIIQEHAGKIHVESEPSASAQPSSLNSLPPAAGPRSLSQPAHQSQERRGSRYMSEATEMAAESLHLQRTARIAGTPRILIIDDEAAIRESLETLLTLEGFTVTMAGDGDVRAATCCRATSTTCCCSTSRCPGESGIDLLPRIIEMQPNLPVIMITAYGTVDNVVDAIRAGAENFVQKPWDNEKLLADIRSAIARTGPKKRSSSSSAR